MNRRAKFDAATFILGGVILNHTHGTNKRTNNITHNNVNDISTPCLSACVDNELSLDVSSLAGFCCLQNVIQLLGVERTPSVVVRSVNV